jgi:hypothetical protein
MDMYVQHYQSIEAGEVFVQQVKNVEIVEDGGLGHLSHLTEDMLKSNCTYQSSSWLRPNYSTDI